MLIATNAVSQQNRVCLGSSLSMRSFAIEEPGSRTLCHPADILKGLNPVDKYDMTSEILFLFEVYAEVRKLTKYIVLLELECQKNSQEEIILKDV